MSECAELVKDYVIKNIEKTNFPLGLYDTSFHQNTSPCAPTFSAHFDIWLQELLFQAANAHAYALCIMEIG